MKSDNIRIGWSEVSITPSRPISIHGQLYFRASQYVHDPVSATALALENGEEQCIMVSMDIGAMHPPYVKAIQESVDGVEGIDAGKITFSATHTHNSSQFREDAHKTVFEKYIGSDVTMEIDKPDDLLTVEESRDFFLGKMKELILRAWRERKPGGISCASDYAAVGFNRRPVFDLGNGKVESKMYGDCSLDSFLRFEGPVDHTIDMIYTWDTDRNLTGILVDVPCPSQVYELHYFISADYWAPARNEIRERLGNVYILPICGAAGDINPLDLVRISKNNKQTLIEWNAQVDEVFRNIDMKEECDSIGERLAEAVSRGYRKAKNYIEWNPVFRHTSFNMELPIRRVTEDDYLEAKAAIEESRKNFSPENRMMSADQVALFEPAGILLRWEQLQESGMFKFQANIIRLGNTALATNPFELFVEYGFRIRARCRAGQVCICQLTNGRGGYLPTKAAVEGGSYSSKPASTTVGPDGGDQLVERVIAEIDKLWE